MDFHALPRRGLQTLCKLNKIPANMTSAAMADALQALPTIEGLDAIVQEAQQYLSPKKAAGMSEAPSRSCRRTSTRKQPNPPGSSVPRTRRAAAVVSFKNEAAAEKEDGGEDDAVVPGVGIPNSPTTLNSRGRRTRTLLTAGPLETGEEEVEAAKKVEPLPLEIPKTPATRGRRAKLGAEELAGKQEEDGAPAIPQTPGATTARRASTRRGGARATPAPEEASGTRSTRYRTRRAVVEEPAPPPEEASGTRSTRYRTRRAVVEEPAAETETAARTRTTSASRKYSKKAADDGVLPIDVSAAGEDGAEGEAPADEGVGEALIPVAVAGGGAAETEHPTLPLSAEPTAEISQPIPEMDGSDGLWVDQTVEKNTTDIVVVEAAGSEGVDLTAAEEIISDERTVVDEEAPVVESIDQTMDKGDEPADQTVEVEESHDPTVEDAPSDQTAAEETILDDQTVVVEEAPVADSIDQTVEVEESHDDQGVVDQTAVEELIQIIAEISLHPTVDDEEENPIAADQTADDGRDLVEPLLEEEMPVAHPMEVEGPVDPTVQEIQVSEVDRDDEDIYPTAEAEIETIDPTVEDGDEIACEETEAAFPEETPMVEDPAVAAGVPASLVTDVVAAEECIVLMAEDGDEFQLSTSDPTVEMISACEGAEAEAAALPEETPVEDTAEGAGVPVSLVADVVAGGGIQILPQEAKEEEAEKEEESAAPGLVVSVAEAGKAADLVQTQQPSMGGDGASFLLGVQDKENAAVKACLMAVVNYDTTSLRKLKRKLKAKEQKKRAALAALDDNHST